jgi:hypothetical protein
MSRRRIFISTGAGAAAVLLIIWWISGGGDNSSSVVLTRDGQTRPATSPTTMNALLPEEYAVLENSNPFGGRGRRGGPEATLVFKGVILAGADYLGFFEDTNAKSVTRKKVGEPVARGRIKSMDLDGLVYESADGSKRIQVGQNLNGETPPPPPPPATKPSEAPAGQPGAPGGPAGRGRGQSAPPQAGPVQMVMPPQ